MTTDLDRATVEEAYARWAPIYDVVFGAVFEPGRKVAIQAAEKIGGRILEFGVGTGMALPNYKRTNRLVGVDISEPMLQKARERVQKEEGPRASFERWFARRARKLGWRPEFQYARLSRWAAANGTVEILPVRNVGLGMYTMVRFRKLSLAEQGSVEVEQVALAG